SPAKRPHQTHLSRLDLKRVRVSSAGRRATVAAGDLTLGPFSGELELTVYAGSPLVHLEAVVETPEERRAFIYDAGLAGESRLPARMAWLDSGGRIQRAATGE